MEQRIIGVALGAGQKTGFLDQGTNSKDIDVVRGVDNRRGPPG